MFLGSFPSFYPLFIADARVAMGRAIICRRLRLAADKIERKGENVYEIKGEHRIASNNKHISKLLSIGRIHVKQTQQAKECLVHPFYFIRLFVPNSICPKRVSKLYSYAIMFNMNHTKFIICVKRVK